MPVGSPSSNAPRITSTRGRSPSSWANRLHSIASPAAALLLGRMFPPMPTLPVPISEQENKRPSPCGRPRLTCPQYTNRGITMSATDASAPSVPNAPDDVGQADGDYPSVIVTCTLLPSPASLLPSKPPNPAESVVPKPGGWSCTTELAALGGSDRASRGLPAAAVDCLSATLIFPPPLLRPRVHPNAR